MTAPVKTQHPDYVAYTDKWARCRDVSAGTDAVHAAGVKYLPKLKEQDETEYRAYQQRAPLFNATWRTIAALGGMLLRVPPRMKVPESLSALLDDVTGDGTGLLILLLELVEEDLTVGRAGLLVDYPRANVASLTQADAQRLNLQPTINLYKAEAIYNWQTRRINNKTVLSQVRLEENDVSRPDEFTEKIEKQYRVLDLDEAGLYRQRVFKVDAGGNQYQVGEDIYPMMKGQQLKFIPFYFVGPDDTSPCVDNPPLIDLVDMNLAHYRVTADYEHGCHFTGLPTPVVSGYTPENPGEKLCIGSTTAWIFPDPSAKATFLEFQGTGLGALKENLEAKKAEMAVLGARMLEQQKRAAETAEVSRVHRMGDVATLASIAQAISIGVEAALQTFSDWAGASGDVEFSLNRDFFPMPLDPQALAALVQAWQSGAISHETLFNNLKAGEIVDEDTTFEDEQAKITNDVGTGLGAPPAPGSGTLPVADHNSNQPQQIVIQVPRGGGRKKITGPNGQIYIVEEAAA
jgi:hypothetical protein